MNEVNYITINEFQNICGVHIKTIIRRIKEIPGIVKLDGEYKVLEGTRYPYNIGNNKLDTISKKRYVLLDAINKSRFIDNKMLKMYPKEFVDLLKELVSSEVIKSNNMCNKYGANYYSITKKGEDVLKLKRKNVIKEITNLVAEAAGKFTGEIITKIYKLNI